jgi:sec-independent protein translocase protein TatC
LILAALLTPGPDVFSQLMLAVPTYALFEISVVLARVLEP